MRLAKYLLVCGALAGCAVHPYQSARVVPGKSVEATYKCAIGQANMLGYSIAQGDKDTGFFKAEKAFTPGIASWDWNQAMKHELAVLVTEQTGGGAKISLTASRYKNGSLEKIGKYLKTDADTIVRACSN